MSKKPNLDVKEEKFIKITSTGNIDLEITLSLSEQDAEIFGVIPEKIETISDCEEFFKLSIDDKKQFIYRKTNIYDYLRLSSENVTINSLLVINRAFKKKAFIEFIALSQLKYKNENMFFKEVIKNVSEQNFLFLVENNFLPNLKSKIKFVIKIENRIVKTFKNICEENTEQQIMVINEEDEKKEDVNKRINSDDYNIINNINLDNIFFNSKEENNQNQNSQKVTESKLSNIKRESKVLINNDLYEHQINNSKINIRDSSNIIFNENENHDVNEYNMSQNLIENSENLLIMEDNIISNDNNLEDEVENKSNLSSNEVGLNKNAHLKLKESQGNLNYLEKDFKVNQIHTENLNKSNFNNNNELDETANKILNSIPNVNIKESKCSHKIIDTIDKNLKEFSNEIIKNNKNENNNNFNDKNLLGDHSNLDRKIAEEEILIKTKNFSNEIINDNNILKSNKNSSKIYLENETVQNLSKKFSEEKKNENEQIKNEGKNKIFDQNEMLSVYERFKYDFSGTDYFFIDMNQMFELKKQNFLITDFHNLLKKITDEQKQITIIINFPNIINNIAFLDLESINILKEIITLTDIFIFDKKDALALFNLMAQINSEDDNYEDKKNLEHLFIKEIKKKRKKHPKIGIFLDELKRVTIIEQQTQSNLILFHTDFELNLIPSKVSKLIADDYRKLFVVHYEMLKSVFIGGLFSRMLLKKPFNSAFTAGNESLKRVIELLRFNLDPPMDPNFFLIRIKKDDKIPNEEEKFRKKKEQHFVLDCANVTTSKMRQYNPLLDNNLSSYFSSKYVRNHLKRLGFINKKGNILQDPDHKKLGIIESKKLNRIYEEEKVNLQKIKDKKEELTLQIKNLLKGNNIMKTGNMKEIEKLAKVYNFNPQAEKILPKLNEFKNSISKKIKINTQMHLKDIYKAKNSRSKIKYHSPNRKMGEKDSISSKNINHEIYDVIEKIEDKIINNQLSLESGNPKIDIQNFSQNKDIKIENNFDKSKINLSIRENRGIINSNSEGNLISAKSKSNNSVKIKKEDSSMNRNVMEHDEMPSAKKNEDMNHNIFHINILDNNVKDTIEKSRNYLNNENKEDDREIENNEYLDVNEKHVEDGNFNIDEDQNYKKINHSNLNNEFLDLDELTNKLQGIENNSDKLQNNDHDIFTNNEIFATENQMIKNNKKNIMMIEKREDDSPKFERNGESNLNEDEK